MTTILVKLVSLGFSYSSINEFFSSSAALTIIVKNKKSQHNYGRRSFSGYNKTVENHLARGSNNNNNDEDDDTPKKKKKKKKKKNNSKGVLNINN